MLVRVVPVEGAPGHVRLNAYLLDTGFFYTVTLEQGVSRIFDARTNLQFTLLAAAQGRLCRFHEISVGGLQSVIY